LHVSCLSPASNPLTCRLISLQASGHTLSTGASH
jgi:hypothetical protein